jgi:hypothetical protein
VVLGWDSGDQLYEGCWRGVHRLAHGLPRCPSASGARQLPRHSF